MSALEGAVVYKEFGRALAPSPHFVSAVMSGRRAAARRARDEQKQAWLPRIVVGRRDRHDRRGSSPATGSARGACRRARRPTATASCSTA